MELDHKQGLSVPLQSASPQPSHGRAHVFYHPHVPAEQLHYAPHAAGRAGGHLLLPEEHASQSTAGSTESCTGTQNDIFQPHMTEKKAVLLSARKVHEVHVC